MRIMNNLLKVTLAVLVIYSTATASAQDKAAMLEGLDALRRSMVSACTRSESPCTKGIAIVSRMVREETSGQGFRDLAHRPLDGSPRPVR